MNHLKVQSVVLLNLLLSNASFAQNGHGVFEGRNTQFNGRAVFEGRNVKEDLVKDQASPSPVLKLTGLNKNTGEYSAVVKKYTLKAQPYEFLRPSIIKLNLNSAGSDIVLDLYVDENAQLLKKAFDRGLVKEISLMKEKIKYWGGIEPGIRQWIIRRHYDSYIYPAEVVLRDGTSISLYQLRNSEHLANLLR